MGGWKGKQRTSTLAIILVVVLSLPPTPPGEQDRLVALLAFAITDEAEMGVREFFLTPAESAKGTKNQSHQSL